MVGLPQNTPPRGGKKGVAMTTKRNGDVVLTEAEAAKYQALLDKEAAEEKAAAEEAERAKARAAFKSSIPVRTPEQLAKVIDECKTFRSVTFAHPDYGILTGIVAEVAPTYYSKKRKEGSGSQPHGVHRVRHALQG